MKTSLAVFCIITAFFMTGCLKEEKNVQGTAIELNNGEKWKVDPGMLEHITVMQNAIYGFESGGDTDALKENLKENIKGLTSKCTMKGQAHDELHKWLMPFIKSIDEIDDEKSVEALRHHFTTFHTYFN